MNRVNIGSDNGLKFQWNNNQNTNIFIHEIASEIIVCKMADIFPGRVGGGKGGIKSVVGN